MFLRTKALPLSDNSPHAVYCVRKHQFIDMAGDRASAETALKRYAPEYGPNLVVLSQDGAMACHEAAFRSEVSEITAAVWDDMLGVLPPMAWRRDGAGESFKLSEYLTGAIIGIYVALDGRYFTSHDNARLPPAECCERVRASEAFLKTRAQGQQDLQENRS
jgi:Protein of unknown function (DUF1419)